MNDNGASDFRLVEIGSDKAFDEIARLREEALSFLDKAFEAGSKEEINEYMKKGFDLLEKYQQKLKEQVDRTSIVVVQKY